MSGPSTYVPKSAIGRWFESRLPIMGLMHSSFVVYPTPKNLNYFWTFGGILAVMLGVQIITGIVAFAITVSWLSIPISAGLIKGPLA